MREAARARGRGRREDWRNRRERREDERKRIENALIITGTSVNFLCSYLDQIF
jgi:hypothetical protein